MSVRLYSEAIADELADEAKFIRQEKLAQTLKTRRQMKAQASQNSPGGSNIGSQRVHSAPRRMVPRHNTMDSARARVTEQKIAEYRETVRKDEIAHKKQTREMIALKKANNQKKFDNMLAQLDAEQSMVDQIGSYLTVKEQASRRKQEQQYKDWNKDVFQPIQDQIRAGLKGRPTHDIEKRRINAMQEYIDVTNKKDGVFRDILIDDYDPLKQRQQALTYTTKKIADPLKADLDKIQWEADLIASMNDDYVRIVPQQKETLDLLLWDRLESTPYCRYAGKPQDQRRSKGQRKENPPEFNNSTMKLDHYKLERDPKVASLEYFHRGVRTEGLKYKQQQVDKPWQDNPLYHLCSVKGTEGR